MTTSLYTVRAATEADENFIYSSFLKSFKADNFLARRIPGNIYFAHQHAIIENILRGDSKTLVAVASDSPVTILGYLIYCASPTILHYAYVKEPFRRLGICRDLVGLVTEGEEGEIYYTHATYYGWKVIPKIRGDRAFLYNPYLAGAST